ncbi:MAG: hypothetical protein ACKV2T_02495 [Kofleriaceae bacterium]
MRCALVAAVVLASAPTSAQPADPYAPAPAAPADPYGPPKPNPYPGAKNKAPGPIDNSTTLDPYTPDVPAPKPPMPPSAPPGLDDSVLAEQIAQSLVARAQELYDARVFVDAKQLALEALQQSANGAAGEHARYLVRLANKQLGLPDQPLPGDTIKIDAAVEEDDKVKIEDVPLPPQPERPDWQVASRVHAALYFGLLGTTIGSFISKDNPENGAIPVGLGAAIGGALVAPVIEDRLGWTEAQMRTVGSGTAWGGVVGGFFGDAVKKSGTKARHVLVGASIGSTIGGLAGVGVASQKRFTRGDVALVDTFAGIGALGGLTLGMLMQPAEGEAYSVNAIVGATAGWVTGFIAGPLTDTTPKRMSRVMFASALGGSVPFLLYAAIYDDTSDSDERAVGFLSTTGLVLGAYVGFRLTRGMANGTDTHDGTRKKDADELGLFHRHADGHWALGTLGVHPLSPLLAPQPGAHVPLVGGSW